MRKSLNALVAGLALAGVTALVVFAGCDASTPKGTNTRLMVPVHAERTKGNTDIVIVGRFNHQTLLSKRAKGDWVTTRYLVVFDVVRVDEGQWDDHILAFVASDRWPTPESGITIDKLPWPYRPGVTMVFELQSPNTIIGQRPLPESQPASGVSGE